MKQAKRKRLKQAGWTIGNAEDFLELSKEETRFLEFKLALASCLRQRREEQNLTQNELAELLHSSQSRVAKMEAGDPSVSIDLLVKSLLALGVSKKELGRSIS